MPGSRRHVPRLALLALLAVIASGVVGAVATGADPDKGTVSLEPGKTMTGWNGKTFAAGASVSRQICTVPEQCDEFELTVDIPAEHWETNSGGVLVNISTDDAEDDFDLYVLDSEGTQVARSANGGTTGEQVLIPDASGVYRVVVTPYTVTDASYKGGAIVESRADAAPADTDVPTEPLSDVKCQDGKAGPFPCKDVDLEGFLPVAALNDGEGTDLAGDPVELNDIWGWTDPETGREYAIVGKTIGTAFVDITDPKAPKYLGSLPSHQPVPTIFKTWRDMKVYEDHVYIGSEEPLHGLQVFDLTRLRDVTEPQTFTEDAHYPLFGNSHNIAINEDSGFLYAIGTSTCEGGPHIVDIREPKAPKFAGCVFQDGYTHDTQCVNYDGPDTRYQGREICFSSNEDTVTIVDVTDKLNPVQLSRVTYDGSAYTHQGWLTEDKRSLIVNDELDEQASGEPTTSRIFNVEKLDAPVLRGAYKAKVDSIDHNLYTKDGIVYEANYRSGLRVLDGRKANEGELSELGFFDVYPPDDAAEFNGSWSTFPYYESGVVVVSGIEQGLFVVRPKLPGSKGGGQPQGEQGGGPRRDEAQAAGTAAPAPQAAAAPQPAAPQPAAAQSTSAKPASCTTPARLRAVRVTPRGRALAFGLTKAGRGAVTVDVFRRVAGKRGAGRLVTRLTAKGSARRWTGRGARDGAYLVRFRMGREVRRAELRRSGGRWRVVRTDAPARCAS